MAKKQQQTYLNLIQKIITEHKNGASIQDIIVGLNNDELPRRTLQSWLKKWVELDIIQSTGQRRGVLYFCKQASVEDNSSSTFSENQSKFPYSQSALNILKQIQKPLIQRKPVAYQYEFLNSYRPNQSSYLSPEELEHLNSLNSVNSEQPAGTFARQLLNRFLIDLSWNSSRLEGNTYSLLDTRRLIHFGTIASGKASIEAQMILNHKEAIEFLVESAQDIGFNRYTVLNLHAMLSNNLLENPQASGRLRTIAVGIGKSAYQPLEVPQLIETYFEQILATASAIKNPFEQAMFILVQLPYLQAFDDVNKRVSRLAANIPFVKHNMIPLSFTDIPKDTYTEAILALYELNQIGPLKELFIWAYERSVDQYKVVQQSLGAPDEFKLRLRNELKTVIVGVIKELMTPKQSYQYIKQWMQTNIQIEDQVKFQEYAETELLALHEGNFARFQIRPSEFEAWQTNWKKHH